MTGSPYVALIRKALEVGGTPPLPPQAVRELAALVREQQVPEGEVLARPDSPADGMWFVREGEVRIRVPRREDRVMRFGSGTLIGEIGILHGGVRSAWVEADSDLVVGWVGRDPLGPVLDEFPQLLDALARVATSRKLNEALDRTLQRALSGLQPEVRHALTSHATWVRMDRGDVLFEEGDPGDAGYVVVSGEVLAVSEHGGKWRVYGGIPAGQLVGEIGIVSSSARTATVVAHVESWLARFSREDLRGLLIDHPEQLLELVDVVVHRLSDHRAEGSSPSVNRIALLPLESGLPIRELAEGVAGRASAWGTSIVRDKADVVREGLLAADAPVHAPAEWVRLKTWLDLRRLDTSHVFLIGDATDTAWNRRLVQEADLVLLVGKSGGDPRPAPVEALLPEARSDLPWHLPRVLVLLHQPDTLLPEGTAAWLDAREVDRWFHVRTGHRGDQGRLARFIGGRMVGLALSGGAARGMAHIGTWQALRERSVPVDQLSGTSMGSAVAALLGELLPEEAVVERFREGREVFGAPWRSLTLPLLGLIDPRRAHAALQHMFGDRQLEDLWLPVTVVSTDLTARHGSRHERGTIWRICIASSSPPGVAPPVPIEGHLHVDGGVVDNLPVGALVEAGCRTILASSVGLGLGEDEEPDELPGPWRALWRRIVSREPVRVPTMPEIVVRAMGMASWATEARDEGAIDLQFTPPVAHISFMDFSRLDELVSIGLEHAREVLSAAHDLPVDQEDSP